MPGAPYCGLSRKSKPSLRQSVWWIWDSAPRPLSTTRARTAGVASSSSQPVCVYGGLSDGTLPSTLPMTKNGAPSTDSSSSYQCTGGSGTSVCSDSALITLYCESKSASRKIVCEVGFTRITKPADRASPPSFHDASKSSVSFEKPVNAGPMSAEIVRSRASGSLPASQSRMTPRALSRSRCSGMGMTGLP